MKKLAKGLGVLALAGAMAGCATDGLFDPDFYDCGASISPKEAVFNFSHSQKPLEFKITVGTSPYNNWSYSVEPEGLGEARLSGKTLTYLPKVATESTGAPELYATITVSGACVGTAGQGVAKIYAINEE